VTGWMLRCGGFI